MYKVLRTIECPEDKPFGVVNPDTEDCRGCWETEAKARKQLKELQALMDGNPDSVLPPHPLHFTKQLPQRAEPEDDTAEWRRWA